MPSLNVAGRVGVLACVAVVGLTGCGSGSNGGSATIGTSGVHVEVDNTINYASVGTTAQIDCADGKSLTIGGSNNTLTVKGTCTTVSIGGADNKITFENIDKDLNVVGLNNTVGYKAGDPKVSDLGSGNSIKKG